MAGPSTVACCTPVHRLATVAITGPQKVAPAQAGVFRYLLLCRDRCQRGPRAGTGPGNSIETMLGPATPPTSRRALFALVSDPLPPYHQQTKNLLGALLMWPSMTV